MIKHIVWVLLLVLSVGMVSAQEAEATEELPEIPYFRSMTGFNVPILGDSWTDQSVEDTAIFVNADAQATIVVEAVFTLDDEQAIVDVIGQYIDGVFPQPIYQDRAGLPNGTWTQQIFQSGDVSISALALMRGDRTYVVALIENNPAFDLRHLALRTPRDADAPIDTPPNREAGMQLALTTLFGDEATFTPDTMALDELPSGEWEELATSDGLLMGLQFGDFTYTVAIIGDTTHRLSIANGINTVFLGFFITPVNRDYLYLGLTITAVVMLGLVGSMWIRYQNVQKDLRTLDQLSES